MLGSVRNILLILLAAFVPLGYHPIFFNEVGEQIGMMDKNNIMFNDFVVFDSFTIIEEMF